MFFMLAIELIPNKKTVHQHNEWHSVKHTQSMLYTLSSRNLPFEFQKIAKNDIFYAIGNF